MDPITLSINLTQWSSHTIRCNETAACSVLNQGQLRVRLFRDCGTVYLRVICLHAPRRYTCNVTKNYAQRLLCFCGLIEFVFIHYDCHSLCEASMNNMITDNIITWTHQGLWHRLWHNRNKIKHPNREHILWDILYVCRDHSGYGLSQWETTLHCNVVSHWQSPCTEWSLCL